jgi:hypothetical protein
LGLLIFDFSLAGVRFALFLLALLPLLVRVSWGPLSFCVFFFVFLGLVFFRYPLLFHPARSGPSARRRAFIDDTYDARPTI